MPLGQIQQINRMKGDVLVAMVVEHSLQRKSALLFQSLQSQCILKLIVTVGCLADSCWPKRRRARGFSDRLNEWVALGSDTVPVALQLTNRR